MTEREPRRGMSVLTIVLLCIGAVVGLCVLAVVAILITCMGGVAW